MSKILKKTCIKMVYCGIDEFRGEKAMHTVEPSQDELKYAVILAESRGHDTVYIHYNNVVSLNTRKVAKEEQVAVES